MTKIILDFYNGYSPQFPSWDIHAVFVFLQGEMA